MNDNIIQWMMDMTLTYNDATAWELRAPQRMNELVIWILSSVSYQDFWELQLPNLLKYHLKGNDINKETTA